MSGDTSYGDYLREQDAKKLQKIKETKLLDKENINKIMDIYWNRLFDYIKTRIDGERPGVSILIRNIDMLLKKWINDDKNKIKEKYIVKKNFLCIPLKCYYNKFSIEDHKLYTLLSKYIYKHNIISLYMVNKLKQEELCVDCKYSDSIEISW